jgi:hypothetical protein
MRTSSLHSLVRTRRELFRGPSFRALVALVALGACALVACGGMVAPGPEGSNTNGVGAADAQGVVSETGTTTGSANTGTGANAGGGPGAAAGDEVTLIDSSLGITGTFASFVGQSVTIPAGGPFDHVRFNWYAFEGAGHPEAFGTLYVLRQPYLGAPSALGPSTPGFVGKSVANEAGQYVFAPDLALTGGARYWFYTDTAGDFLTAKATSEDMYPGGEQYLSSRADAPFAEANGGTPPPAGYFMDATFRLQGRGAR